MTWMILPPRPTLAAICRPSEFLEPVPTQQCKMWLREHLLSTSRPAMTAVLMLKPQCPNFPHFLFHPMTLTHLIMTTVPTAKLLMATHPMVTSFCRTSPPIQRSHLPKNRPISSLVPTTATSSLLPNTGLQPPLQTNLL